jgi:hypothetical protein
VEALPLTLRAFMITCRWEGGKEGGREGGKEGGREGGREGGSDV